MATSFQNQITPDGKFPPEANRYHLYIGRGCPFAHRADVLYNLKGLQDVIGLSVVDYEMKDGYWQFGTGRDGVTEDKVNGFKSIKELYDLADPTYAGRCTVPVLYDTKLKTIVNNESHDILRIFDSQFDNIAKYPKVSVSPLELRSKIDEVNNIVIPPLLSVYKTSSQAEYEQSFNTFFNALDSLEEKLSKTRYLLGDKLTESDIKLFVVLIRFDVGFYLFSKMNKKQLRDYPNLFNYIKEIYQHEHIKPTVNFHHIKGIYFTRSTLPEPRLVPIGPDTSHYEIPHDRSTKFQN